MLVDQELSVEAAPVEQHGSWNTQRFECGLMYSLWGPAGFTAKTDRARAFNSISSFVWHSQIVKTCHPRTVSLSTTDASLALLAANFACQKSGRVAGVVASGHPGC